MNFSIDSKTNKGLFMGLVICTLGSIIANSSTWTVSADSCYARGPNFDLHGCNFTSADLSNLNLFGVNLSGANLFGANLSGTNLSNANLLGANLTILILLMQIFLMQTLVVFATMDVLEHQLEHLRKEHCQPVN